MQAQIIQIIFLIALRFVVYDLEIASLPSLPSSFSYIMGFTSNALIIYGFLAIVGIVIPMLFMLSMVAFGSKYFLFDPKNSKRLYLAWIQQYLKTLILLVCILVVTILLDLDLCSEKSTYFILRLSYLGHNNPVSHILSVSLVLTLIIYAMLCLNFIAIHATEIFLSKYGTSVILSNFVRRNAHFLVPYAFCFILYPVMVWFIFRRFNLNLENFDASWSITLGFYQFTALTLLPLLIPTEAPFNYHRLVLA